MSTSDDAPMTTMDWVLTHILMALPIVNLIFFVIWSVGSGNRSRVTYCRAQLLIVFMVLAMMAFLSLLGVGIAPLLELLPPM